MKSVLVTGAAGGMGSAAVRMLCEQGYRVYALDRRRGEARKNVQWLECDITDEQSVRQAAAQVQADTGELFAILHYAGIYLLDSLVEMDSADFEGIFRVNVFGAFYVNRAFLPLLRAGSRIVLVTSELAPLDPLPFTGIYAVTKGALDRYAYSLRMELQLLGIAVCVIRAGAVDTGMLGASTAALERFCAKTSLYSCNAARFRHIVDSVEAKCVPPEKIAQKTLSLLRKPNPPFVSCVNRNPLLLGLNLLPKRAQLWVIRQVLR